MTASRTRCSLPSVPDEARLALLDAGADILVLHFESDVGNRLAHRILLGAIPFSVVHERPRGHRRGLAVDRLTDVVLATEGRQNPAMRLTC